MGSVHPHDVSWLQAGKDPSLWGAHTEPAQLCSEWGTGLIPMEGLHSWPASTAELIEKITIGDF